MAFAKFNETHYQMPQVSLEESAFEAHGRYRWETLADPEMEERLNYLRQKRQIETLIGIGASVVGFVWDFIKHKDVRNLKQEF